MRQTWLFQANPRYFDIDGYLATEPSEFLWLARQHSARMQVGDQVFLWRSVGGGDEGLSGVIAEADLTGTVASVPEEPTSLPFWLEGDPALAEDRVRLRLKRRAAERTRIRRKWVQEDPLLRDMTVLTARVGTNFLISPDHSRRLNALWSNTGRDWSYAESVAGLWAFSETSGAELSKLPGSTVAQVALLIGRAVGGVYNKVLNFRSLDPRDARAGLSGGGEMDRAVWARFYDPVRRVLAEGELRTEFLRLWGESPKVAEPAVIAVEEGIEAEADRLSKLTLAELMARFEGRAKGTGTLPRTSLAQARRFERDPLVVAIAKKRAGFKCEVPACAHPNFIGADGQPYCEAHHIQPLHEGGADTLRNVACVCPAHHREAHLGKDAALIAAALSKVRSAVD